jgi:hypothetical protein
MSRAIVDLLWLRGSAFQETGHNDSARALRIKPCRDGRPPNRSARSDRAGHERRAKPTVPANSARPPATAERNTNNGTRQAIGAHPILWRSLSRGDRFDYAPLDVDKLRVAVASQKLLESRVVLRLERALMTESIPNWMRRIEMSARNPSHR